MLREIVRTAGNIWKIAALWSVLAAVHAQDDASASAAAVGAAPGTNPPSAQLAQPERHWRLGAALGYGRRSNPVIQSRDIPVIVDVDIAWFGKRWFFDNGDIGFTMLDRPSSTTSLVARLNDDRVFFGKTNTRYVNFAYTSSGLGPLVDPATGVKVDQPVQVDPPDRDYAVELGIESLIDGDWGSATLRAFHDVSGTHHGYELSASYSRRWTAGRLSVTPTVGVAYKSARLNDYYWGVHQDEATFALPAYEAGDGFGFEGGLVANYYLSRNLRLALSVNYERLADDVAASPLAKEDHVLAYFSGLAWSF